MANIRIEEKEKSGSILPWILGLLLLALIVWGLLSFFGGEEDIIDTEEPIEEVVTSPVASDVDYAGPIAEYMALTADMEGEMRLDHEFSHDALSKLASASAALAESKGVEDAVSAEGKSRRVMTLANDITKDPMADDHADKIKMAAMLITEILEDVNEKGFNGRANASLEKLRSEAQAVSGETLTLDQKENVRSFFAQARVVLQEMS